jgi:glycosyltransferase involved in cell wall biosynthesis
VTGDVHEPVAADRRSARLTVTGGPSPGVNLVGFLEAESGLGEIARRIAAALERAAVPLSAISYRGTERRQLHPHGLSLSDEAPYDTSVVCLNPGHLPGFVADVGSAFFARRYAIGVWFWETNRFRTGERNATRFLDELWVTSSYVRDAIEPDVDVPVRVLPVPMERPTGPFRTRAELDLPDGFTFLFVFDFWSEERKNPAAIVEAFTKAFRSGEGPTLVLKSIHGDSKARELERLEAIVGGRGDILVRDGYVSAVERDSYLAACDCYVSLHRSEGLGLTMAESMALGKPVIATGYSGNLEFMSESNSYLVPSDLVDVPESWWAHASGARWAEPDVDAAAALMREVWENRDESRAIGERGRDELLDRFSPDRTAEFVARRLEELRTEGAITARVSAPDARPAIVDASRALAAQPGASLARRARRWPSSFVRRVLRRGLWPYLEDQRRVDVAMLDALSSLQRSVDDLERRVSRLESSPTPMEADAAIDRSSRP